MMKNIITTFLFFITFIIYAHNGLDHSKPSNKETHTADTSAIRMDTTNLNNQEANETLLHGKENMPPFSTLHPLIVHFPIVLLIILPFFQIASLFKFKREIGWVVIILTSAGFITAYLAGNNFHPHTTGLTQRASKILEEHDFYAYLTVWISFGALGIKLISQFILRLNKWSEYVVLLFLIGAAYSVMMAGHHGSQLTHIEGVGPQGKYLELDMNYGEEHSH